MLDAGDETLLWICAPLWVMFGVIHLQTPAVLLAVADKNSVKIYMAGRLLHSVINLRCRTPVIRLISFFFLIAALIHPAL